MSIINKAIVISDMHLGKDDSYLFSPDKHYTANRQAVKDLFLRIGHVDELILDGDILELATAGLDIVYRELKGFFKLLTEVNPIKKIVFIPGNHDHHFWRSIVEHIEIDGRIRKGKLPPGHNSYAKKFVDRRYTSLNPDHEPFILFPHLWPKNTQTTDIPEFVVKYPHHLLKVPQPQHKNNPTDKWQYHLVTHGHFLEELFKPVNYLIEPTGLAQLEAYNNIWLESFNYYLGHSGELSRQVRELEKRFLEGGIEAKGKVTDIFQAVYENLKKSINLKCPWTLLVKFILKRFITLIPEEKMGRSRLRGADVTNELLDSVKEYIKKYLIGRYVNDFSELVQEECHTPKKCIPTPFTFIFGHTHIPFQTDIKINGDIFPEGKIFPVINTGGWIRSDGDGTGKGKYAGVVVVDGQGAHWESLDGQLDKE